MGRSTYNILGWPDEIAITLFVFGLICVLAPYVSEVDLGIFKVPKLTDPLKMRARRFGPVFVFIVLAAFFPLWPAIADTKVDGSLAVVDAAPTDDKIKSNLGAFSVIDKSTLLDLRELAVTSNANLYHTIQVRVTGDGERTLRLPYKTGGASLDVVCLTHPYRVFTSREPETNSAGTFLVSRLVEIDIDEPNVTGAVTITNTATYHSAFNQFPRYGLITNRQSEPQTSALTVLFPASIPVPTFKVYKLVNGKRTESRDHVSRVDEAAHSIHVTVSSTEIDVQRTYLVEWDWICLLYTSPSPRDQRGSRMPSSA